MTNNVPTVTRRARSSGKCTIPAAAASSSSSPQTASTAREQQPAPSPAVVGSGNRHRHHRGGDDYSNDGATTPPATATAATTDLAINAGRRNGRPRRAALATTRRRNGVRSLRTIAAAAAVATLCLSSSSSLCAGLLCGAGSSVRIRPRLRFGGASTVPPDDDDGTTMSVSAGGGAAMTVAVVTRVRAARLRLGSRGPTLGLYGNGGPHLGFGGGHGGSVGRLPPGRRGEGGALLSSATSCFSAGVEEEEERPRPRREHDGRFSSPFYERIGSPTFVAAPMVAQSDYAFRRLCRGYGVQCAFTQMYHARNFCESEAFRGAHLDVWPSYVRYLERPAIDDDDSDESGGGRGAGGAIRLGRSARRRSRKSFRPSTGTFGDLSLPLPHEDGPLIAQLAGHDPPTVLSAARTLLDLTDGNVQGIDLNLGCPQAIARKGRYGAFLLREMDVVCDVLSTLRDGLPESVGVTAKIRVPDDDDPSGSSLGRCVRRIASCGVDMITVHGRTLVENKTAVRGADWDKIAAVVRVATGEFGIPVVANGGIEHPGDVGRCLRHTGAAAVMSSEALLENPGLFDPSAIDESRMSGRDVLERQFRYAGEYMDLAGLFPPVPGSSGTRHGSHAVVKGHLFKILHRYLAEHDDLRDRLADGRTCRMAQTRGIVDELRDRYADLDVERLRLLDSSDPNRTWYRRHRVPTEVNGLAVHARRVDTIMERNGRGIRSAGGGARNNNLDVLGGSNVGDLPIEERKKLMQRRIEKLRQSRLLKEKAQSKHVIARPD